MARPYSSEYTLYASKHRRKIRYHNKGSHIIRDSEKSKTYLAESSVEKDKEMHYNVYLTKEEAENFVSKIVKSKFWDKHGTGRVKVEWMKDMGVHASMVGYGTRGMIKLAPSCVTKLAILHELTHVAGYYNHGRGFRAFQIKIISRFLGRETAGKLKKAYKEAKLSITPVGKTLDYDKWIERYIKVKDNLKSEK